MEFAPKGCLWQSLSDCPKGMPMEEFAHPGIYQISVIIYQILMGLYAVT